MRTPQSVRRQVVVWFVLAAIAAIGLVFDLADFTERITSPFYALVLFIAFIAFVSVGVRKLFMANAALQAERDHLKDASPSIRSEKVGGPSEVSLGPIGHVDRKLEMWQFWFVNEPHIRGAMAVAKELRAVIEPCDSDWK